VLGPKVGKQIGAVKAALGKLNGSKAKAELDATGKLVVALPDGEVTLTTEDVEVSMAQTEGFNCQRYNGVTIALDTTLTEELLEEGFVREIISKVQTMRKENGFEVTDHIKVSLSGNEKLQAIVAKNEDYLKEITLADAVAYGTLAGEAKEWNINGENVTIAVE
jgi:isoleucyl-tRNA synthetase